MKTTEDWLKEKIEDYDENQSAALKDILLSTTLVIKQYIESPSELTKSVLDSCLLCNKLFLKNIGIGDMLH